MNSDLTLFLTCLLLQQQFLLEAATVLLNYATEAIIVDFGKVKTLRALMTNFARGRGTIKEKDRTYLRQRNVYQSISDEDLKTNAHLTCQQYRSIIQYLEPKWDEIFEKSRVK